MAQHRPPCPVCGIANAAIGDAPAHVSWHTRRDDLDGWRPGALLDELAGSPDDETAKLPPIRETVLRRPPALEVRELKGRDLLLALAAELRDVDEDQADDEPGVES